MKREELQKLIHAKLGDYRFIVVSNRQPYQHAYKRGKIEWQKATGGLVMAMDSVMQACNGLWLAFGDSDADHRVVDQDNKIQVPPSNPTYTLKRIFLSKEQEEGYYYGFSSDTLWPLCHMSFQRPTFRQQDWEQYCQVNRKFAQAIIDEIGTAKAFVWIHDYHLCLLPKYLKEMAGDNLIVAHFWHIPWPSFETFRICPNKEEILDGLLANDLLGFHINYHCNNFLDNVDRLLESKIDRERFSVVRGNHETLIRPFPISVDYQEANTMAVEARDSALQQTFIDEFNLKDKKILLGVDRIDYTKGIPERLLAIDRLLAKNPQLKEKIIFLQIGVVSRIHLDKYKQLNDEINALVERVNWKHSSDSWNPITLTRRQLSFKELLALYQLADVCVVSSLHDGMNLVAKEFVSSRVDEDGVLVLSQFAGSASELKDAILINPYDQEQFSDLLLKALTLPKEDRRKRMIKMRQVVAENNIFSWAGKVVTELLKIQFEQMPVTI